MKPGVIPIMQTKLDLSRWLPIARNVLGYSVAKAADAATVPLSDMPHALACLAAFKDEKAPASVSWAWPQWDLLSAGFFIVAEELDMVGILDMLAGMPVTVAETTQRHILAAVVSGTLAQWRQAVKKACNGRQEPGVCAAFNTIYRHLEAEGLRDLFHGLKLTPQTDNTFLLEDKR
jgi:hypothetical protein